MTELGSPVCRLAIRSWLPAKTKIGAIRFMPIAPIFSEQPPFWLLYPNHSGNCGLCFVSADHKLIPRVDGPETEVCKTLIKIPNTVSVQTPGKKEEGTVCNYSIEAPKGSRILYR